MLPRAKWECRYARKGVPFHSAADFPSEVFSSASETCDDGQKRIEFTDTDLERAPVVRVYRQLLRRMTFLAVTSFEQCVVMCDTVEFLRKYECEGLLRLVKTECMNRLLLKTMPPLYAFMLGAVMDDIELCVAALQYRYDVEVRRGEARFVDAHILSLSPDVQSRGATWSLEIYERLPMYYAWAITSTCSQWWGSLYAKRRAPESLYYGRDTVPDYDIVEEFERYIKWAKSSQSVQTAAK